MEINIASGLCPFKDTPYALIIIMEDIFCLVFHGYEILIIHGIYPSFNILEVIITWNMGKKVFV